MTFFLGSIADFFSAGKNLIEGQNCRPKSSSLFPFLKELREEQEQAPDMDCIE